MKESFALPLTDLSVAADRITASARLESGSRWYEGHFPGRPILPGMAVVALVAEAIIAAERREGSAVTITGLARVRFRLPVLPGETILIRVSRPTDGGGRYPFAVTLAGEALCSGILETDRKAAASRYLDNGIGMA
jgi:3-hydroxymyristoyl/3-hydroxydecanoyl-(acyl carrier protein) dehydratase